MLKAVPFVLASGLCCYVDEELNPIGIDDGKAVEVEDAAGSGSSGEGGADCIENNGGPGIEGAVVDYYAVQGNVVEDAARDIFDSETGKGYKDNKTGKRYADITECSLEYASKFDGVSYLAIAAYKIYCVDLWVTESKVSSEFNVKLPRWGECDSCWDLFIDGLVEHVRGHAGICMNIGDRFKEELTKITVTECRDWYENEAWTAAEAALENKINWLYLRAQLDYIRDFEDYNEKTGHGETQGAVLVCNK